MRQLHCVNKLVKKFNYRFIPDSPRWMLLHGQVKKSKEILLKSAEINKRAVPEDIDHLLSVAASTWYRNSDHKQCCVSPELKIQ